MLTAKENAALDAQDNARLGYRGGDGAGARLLRACAEAVRLAAHNVRASYGVPTVSADERAEYASELAALILGDNGGRLPDLPPAKAYLVKRARGLIIDDYERRGFDLNDPGPTPRNRADDKLTGPLSIPAEVAEIAARLPVSESGRRAFVATLVPATRAEWAAFYGYGSADSWREIARRGRIELRSLGESYLRGILAAL